jgi:hypothetical protein
MPEIVYYFSTERSIDNYKQQNKLVRITSLPEGENDGIMEMCGMMGLKKRRLRAHISH